MSRISTLPSVAVSKRSAREVRLDQGRDQFGFAVVEGVRPAHLHRLDVRQAGEDVGAVDPHERVAVSSDHERGHDQVPHPFERRVAGHRLEQRQAPERAEPEVVANRDRQHRWGLAEPVNGHLPQRPGKWLVVGPAGRRDQDGVGDAVGERGRDLDDDRAAQRVADQRRPFDADGIAVGHEGPSEAREVERLAWPHAPPHSRQVGDIAAVTCSEQGRGRLEVRPGDAEPVDVDDRVGGGTCVQAGAVEHGEPVDDDPLRLERRNRQPAHVGRSIETRRPPERGRSTGGRCGPASIRGPARR